MDGNRNKQQYVTLVLEDPDGQNWALTLSRSCLQFIGRYQRIEGFNVAALKHINGVQKSG